jgi:predicted nucleic acid-binding protein
MSEHMKLVLDANVLFSFFKEGSFTREVIILHDELELLVPAYII